MQVDEIAGLLAGEALVGNKNEEIEFAFASDNLSDVLNYVKYGKTVLLTGMCDEKVVRAADFVGISCIVLVRGKTPDKKVLSLAKDKGVSVVVTDYQLFYSCSVLSKAGLLSA